MADITTIDGAGRVVIPKRLRDALRLLPQTRLRIIERDRSIVLEPLEDAPLLVERDGLVLLGGELAGSPPSARDEREERVATLLERATRRRSR